MLVLEETFSLTKVTNVSNVREGRQLSRSCDLIGLFSLAFIMMCKTGFHNYNSTDKFYEKVSMCLRQCLHIYSRVQTMHCSLCFVVLGCYKIQYLRQ